MDVDRCRAKLATTHVADDCPSFRRTTVSSPSIMNIILQLTSLINSMSEHRVMMESSALFSVGLSWTAYFSPVIIFIYITRDQAGCHKWTFGNCWSQTFHTPDAVHVAQQRTSESTQGTQLSVIIGTIAVINNSKIIQYKRLLSAFPSVLCCCCLGDTQPVKSCCSNSKRE